MGCFEGRALLPALFEGANCPVEEQVLNRGGRFKAVRC